MSVVDEMITLMKDFDLHNYYGRLPVNDEDAKEMMEEAYYYAAWHQQMPEYATCGLCNRTNPMRGDNQVNMVKLIYERETVYLFTCPRCHQKFLRAYECQEWMPEVGRLLVRRRVPRGTEYLASGLSKGKFTLTPMRDSFPHEGEDDDIPTLESLYKIYIYDGPFWNLADRIDPHTPDWYYPEQEGWAHSRHGARETVRHPRWIRQDLGVQMSDTMRSLNDYIERTTSQSYSVSDFVPPGHFVFVDNNRTAHVVRSDSNGQGEVHQGEANQATDSRPREAGYRSSAFHW